MNKKRKLKIRAYHVDEVKFAEKVEIKDSVLQISKSKIEELEKKYDVIKKIDVSIIKPGEHNVNINTIMDIVPISSKVLGKLGEGISHTITGVYLMVTAKDEDDRQMAAFGSSDGVLNEQIVLNRAGTPSDDDYIIHFDVLIKGGLAFDRNLPNSAIGASDDFLDEIRAKLKHLDAKYADEEHIFYDIENPKGKRVLIAKLIAGQGACYDNKLFNEEPSGFKGGKSIIDMGNVPMILTPNEYRDGAIRALT